MLLCTEDEHCQGRGSSEAGDTSVKYFLLYAGQKHRDVVYFTAKTPLGFLEGELDRPAGSWRALLLGSSGIW